MSTTSVYRIAGSPLRAVVPFATQENHASSSSMLLAAATTTSTSATKSTTPGMSYRRISIDQVRALGIHKARSLCRTTIKRYYLPHGLSLDDIIHALCCDGKWVALKPREPTRHVEVMLRSFVNAHEKRILGALGEDMDLRGAILRCAREEDTHMGFNPSPLHKVMDIPEEDVERCPEAMEVDATPNYQTESTDEEAAEPLTLRQHRQNLISLIGYREELASLTVQQHLWIGLARLDPKDERAARVEFAVRVGKWVAPAVEEDVGRKHERGNENVPVGEKRRVRKRVRVKKVDVDE